MRNNATSLQKRTGGGAGTTTTAVGGQRQRHASVEDPNMTRRHNKQQAEEAKRQQKNGGKQRIHKTAKNSEITQTHTFTSTPTRNHAKEMAEKRTKTCALTKTTSPRSPIDQKQTHKIDRPSQVRTYHASVHACLSFSAKVESAVVFLLSFRRKARGSHSSFMPGLAALLVSICRVCFLRVLACALRRHTRHTRSDLRSWLVVAACCGCRLVGWVCANKCMDAQVCYLGGCKTDHVVGLMMMYVDTLCV